MKRFFKSSMIIAAFLSYHFCMAQDPNGVELPQLIPPSPVAQQFEKYVGYPVDMSTGLVNISVPLYNLQLPGIAIPFSLKYHASGIKVEDSYGPLGYGWSFFPGFRISRTVMGKIDELYHTDNIQSLNTVPNYTDYLVNMSTPASVGDEVGTSTADGQFDLFSIHLPNYDGGFILKWVNNVLTPVLIPDAPLKIDIVYAGAGSTYISGFTVMDDKGIQYQFGNTFSAINNEYAEGNDQYATSWMLRQIVLPGVNNSLLFHYNTAGVPNLAPSCKSFIYYDNYKTQAADDELQSQLGMSGDCGSNSIQSSEGCAFSGTVRFFQSVEFSAGKVVVTYTSDGLLMSMMAVVNSSGDTVRKISFAQQAQLLTKVSVDGEGDYVLSYNPQRFADTYSGSNLYFAVYQQDGWGFYNKKFNADLLPAIPMSSICGSSSGSLIFGTADRSVDTAAMQANMLEQIIYPTGGFTKFYYEPHTFHQAGTVMYGGGLRIKRIETAASATDNVITKTYTYGTFESGFGNNSGFYPSDGSFIDEKYLYTSGANGPGRCRRQTLNSRPKWRYYSFNLPVWYNEVTEYSDGGKTVYDYDYSADGVTTAYSNFGYDFFDQPISSDVTDVLQYSNNMLMGAPLLQQKRVYKGESGIYTLLHEEDYGYATYHPGQVHGLIVDALAYVMQNGQAPRNYFWRSDMPNILTFSQAGGQTILPFSFYDYYINTGKSNLVSTVQHDYSNGTDLAASVTDDFDNDFPYNHTLTQKTNSKGDITMERYYYPVGSSVPDLTSLASSQQQMINTLKTNNRITALIQQSSFKNTSTPLYSTLYGYKDWGNNILAPEQMYKKTSNNAYESRLHFYNYDSKGNVGEVAKESDGHVCYIWDYSQSFPAAKIVNSDLESVSYTSFEAENNGGWTIGGSARLNGGVTGKVYYSANSDISRSGLNSGTAYTISYWTDGTTGFSIPGTASGYRVKGKTVSINGSAWTYFEHKISGQNSITIQGNGNIDELRLYPATSQMTTYTYTPLVGTTSQCDVNSRITYYEYDSFGRLQDIKDQDGNIIKTFQYHYQGAADGF